MYIPKNRIITNLYTNTNEYVYKGTNVYYKGFYWKMYNGKLFTGKNPNELPNEELELVEATQDKGSIITPTQSQLVTSIGAPTPFLNENEGPYDEELVIQYNKIKGINSNAPNLKSIPYMYYPVPTVDDYNLGVFTRYFTVKINEPIFTEVSKEVHDFIKNNDTDWNWESYTAFNLPWTLIGEKEVVYLTNRDIVYLTEKTIKTRGLREFLKNNYIKYLK